METDNKRYWQNLDMQSRQIKKLLPKAEKSAKTMFKIPDEDYNFLLQLSRTPNFKNIKKTIDFMATVGNTALENGGEINLLEVPAGASHKSVTISENSKMILKNMASELKVSRDCIFYSLLKTLETIMGKKPLSLKDKLKYASVLSDMADKMLAIYESEEAIEARNKLLSSGDEDFCTTTNTQNCEDLLAYIACLYEFTDCIREYTQAKEAELQNIMDQKSS